jgi:HPt (histidine-containing phosphotransfer) domain-containing protein
MIDRSKFREQFKYYDSELIVEVIDVFINELPKRLSDLQSDVENKDFSRLMQNAHSFKGLVGTFLATEPYEISGVIEEMAKKQDETGLPGLFSRLHSASQELAKDLLEIRTEYSP